MKAVTVLLVVIYTVVAGANRCPPAQREDWTIEYLYEHEVNCNQYYHCTHGEPRLRTCPNNLVFNTTTTECGWPFEVDCGDRVIPAPTPPSPSTTTAGSEPSVSTGTPPVIGANGCPVDPEIHWLIPHENDCNRFYYCVWGRLVERRCPSVLNFNRVLQVCDWPVRAGC